MTSFIDIWHKLLSLSSIANLTFIIYHIFTSKTYNKTHKSLLNFAFIYTLVCTIRSIWLKKPIQQICFNNFFLSTPFIGRFISTIAELSFASQITIFVKFISNQLHSLLKIKKPSFYYINCLIPIIYIAQTFCWLACITKFHLWNAVEESLWTIFAFILLIHFYKLYKIIPKNSKNKKVNKIKNILFTKIIFVIFYILFMIFIDIPTYFKRFIDSDFNKQSNITISEFISNFYQKHSDFIPKLFQLFKCKIISKDFDDWKDNIAFFTGYFSIAVWASIYLPIWYKQYHNLT